MACCRGKHHARHCDGDGDSSAVQLRSVNDCGSGCSRAGAAPSFSIEKGLRSADRAGIHPETSSARLKPAVSRKGSSFRDVLLYQRPPPFGSA
jgi:hypothetical protein